MHTTLVSTLRCALLIVATFGAVERGACQIAESPSSKAVTQIRAFSEPVVRCDETAASEDAQVQVLMGQYAQSATLANLDVLTTWATDHPESGWSPSILLNAGKTYYRQGHFTRAMNAWRRGWDCGRSCTSNEGRLTADSCYGELARMLARIGRMTDMEALIAERGTRTLIGPGSTLTEHAEDGLWSMKNRPGVAFKCGPMALANVRQALRIPEALHADILTTESTSAGFSISEVQQLARGMGMNWKPVRRVSSENEYPMPSVVHWKLDHYAALVRKAGDRYLIQDPTFGRDLWVTREALDQESSGYFLVGAEAVTAGCEDVPASKAHTVRGRGYTNECVPDATDCKDEQKGGSAESCPTCPCGPGPTSPFMPTYSFHTMLASLRIADTPVGYEPPYGPPVYLNLAYNQREANQPTIFPFSNFGPKWTFFAMSCIEDNSLYDTTYFQYGYPESVVVRTPLGGTEVHTDWDWSDGFVNRSFGTAKLHKTGAGEYERREKDGWKQIYSHTESDVNTERRILLTGVVDPNGNRITYKYDGNHRLSAVEDAMGRETTFCYEVDSGGNCVTTNSMVIRKVTDPFGRSATFDYDATGRLIRITDALGMASSFTYDGGDFITSIETPYGVTAFTKEPAGTTNDSRWVEATDPVGDRERIEYVRASSLPSVLPASDIPAAGTVSVVNQYLNARTSFFWNKTIMKQSGSSDLEAAERVHFLHAPTSSQTARIAAHRKAPLEGHIFYNYPGQTHYAITGTSSQPSKIARVLDNGETQYTQLDYNMMGNVTSSTDTLGRVTTFEYDTATSTDLLRVRQITGSGEVTLLEAEYDNDHNPVKVTDAAGQVTTATYNANGQITTVANSKEITTLDYTTTGLLHKAISHDPAQYVELAYGDGYDRVTSATQFPEGYTVRFEYDLWGRPTRVIYPDGTYEEQIWDKKDVVRSRDRLGQWTQMSYSLLGQLTTVTNPANETIQLNWCACGSLSRLVDAEGRITAWYRDIQGRLTKKERPDLTAEIYTYETRTSRLKARTDAKGQTTIFTYNNDNTPSQVAVTAAAGTHAVPTVSLTWDTVFRRLTGWTDGLGATTLSYVPYNSGDAVYGDGSIASIDGPWTNDTLAYTYDELGRVVLRSINGSANEASTVYDSLGRVESLTNKLGTFDYDYEASSDQLVKITGPASRITNFSYKGVLDDLRLDSIENKDPAGGVLSKFTYGYDKLSRITDWGQKQDSGSGDPTPHSMRYDRSSRLTQMSKAESTGEGKQWNWRFDRAGNRLSEQVEEFDTQGSTVERKQYAVNLADQLTSTSAGGPLLISGTLDEQGKIAQAEGLLDAVTEEDKSFSAWIAAPTSATAELTVKDWSGNPTPTSVSVTPASPEAPTRALSYDANGNLTQMVTTPAGGGPTSTVNYEWDALNRLMAVETVGLSRTEFVYDGLGRRVKLVVKDASGVVTETRWFLWEGLRIAEEREDSGGAPGAVVKRFFAQGEERGSTLYFYTRDHLGSLREVTDASGNLVARYDYDPYGNPTQTAGTTSFDFLYTGHFWHGLSGMYLAPYRAYDPRLGRWISEEPLGLDGPNLYHYVFNSPVSSYDPSGLNSAAPAAAAAGGIGLGAAIKGVAAAIGSAAAAAPAAAITISAGTGIVIGTALDNACDLSGAMAHYYGPYIFGTVVSASLSDDALPINVVPGSIRKCKDYPTEYDYIPYRKLKEMTKKGDQKAKKVKKAMEQKPRMMGKNSGKPR